MAPPEPVRGLIAGTPVLTPAGPVPVEALQPGMLVLAVSGAAAPFRALAAVRRGWGPGPAIRIRAGALDDGTPQQDLLLPAAHALLLDGALIEAGALVDGHGILPEPGAAPFALVELVLDSHDAVLAAGCAVETVPPAPGAPDCAPRRGPDAALRARLSWRAERMGWAAPAPEDAPPPEAADFRARLDDAPLSPLELDLPPRGAP